MDENVPEVTLSFYDTDSYIIVYATVQKMLNGCFFQYNTNYFIAEI